MKFARILLALALAVLVLTFAPPATAVPLQPTTVAITSVRPFAPRVGGTYAPTAVSTRADRPIVFSSSSPTTCTVSAGVVTFTGRGICVVSADQAGTVTHEPGHAEQRIPILFG